MNFHITYIDAKNIKYDPATDNSGGNPFYCYTSMIGQSSLYQLDGEDWDLDNRNGSCIPVPFLQLGTPTRLGVGLCPFLLTRWQAFLYPQPLNINQVRDYYIEIIVQNTKTIQNPNSDWPHFWDAQDVNMLLIGPGYCHNNLAQIALVYFYRGADPNAHTVISV